MKKSNKNSDTVNMYSKDVRDVYEIRDSENIYSIDVRMYTNIGTLQNNLYMWEMNAKLGTLMWGTLMESIDVRDK